MAEAAMREPARALGCAYVTIAIASPGRHLPTRPASLCRLRLFSQRCRNPRPSGVTGFRRPPSLSLPRSLPPSLSVLRPSRSHGRAMQILHV